jgi:hypothetical protein
MTCTAWPAAAARPDSSGQGPAPPTSSHYPTYRRYLREATRKDDPQWQFELGLDCVLDGVAARMGI